jgi:hypothetical protein
MPLKTNISNNIVWRIMVAILFVGGFSFEMNGIYAGGNGYA